MFNPKKIFALVLLFAVVAPLLFFAGFLVKQSLIQNEMEEQLETKALQTITTDISEVQWLKKNKEVVIDGKMFDVRSFTISGNKIILTGLFDKDEDNLHQQLNSFLQQKGNPNSLNNIAIKFLFPPLYNGTASVTDQCAWKHTAHCFMPYQNEKEVEKYLSSDTPPPRFI